MSPSLATLVYAAGILGLFYLNRDKSIRTSKALWIPVIWFWILGSRAVSVWMAGGGVGADAGQMMDGSPTDAFVFLLLMVGGIVVLARRGSRVSSVLGSNWPVLLYFAYCLLSVGWSDYPDVSIKRWIKATGDVVMALVVLTDLQPTAALRRLFSRLGFVLLPASVLLSKYYPYLGRKYSQWSGQGSITGVTTDKNLLGVTTYILSLGALWQVLQLWPERHDPERRRQLIAQCAVLGFGIWLLCTADSATSTSCFVLGSFVMLMSSTKRMIGRPAAVHKFVLTLVVLLGLIQVTGAYAAVVHAMGRNTDLTGRADIWPVLIPMAPSALVGAGFETFWLGPRLLKVWDAFPNLYVSEAHNGYIEVYLNLGLIGLGIILLLLVNGYRRSVAGFRVNSNLARLMLALVLSAAMYSYTEAGFRMLDYAWSFLLIALIGASNIASLTAEEQESEPAEQMQWSTDGMPTASAVASH